MLLGSAHIQAFQGIAWEIRQALAQLVGIHVDYVVQAEDADVRT